MAMGYTCMEHYYAHLDVYCAPMQVMFSLRSVSVSV